MVALANAALVTLIFFIWVQCGIILKNTFNRHELVRERIGNWIWLHTVVFTTLFWFFEGLLIRYFELVFK